MEKIEIYVDEEDNERLDSYLSNELDQISRTYLQRLIKDKQIEVNGLHKKASYLVKEGDNIIVLLPEPKKLDIIPEDIPLNIIYED